MLLPLLMLRSIKLRDTGTGGVDVDSALLGLTLQVDIESIVVLGIGKDLGTIESHDMVRDRFDRLGSKVHVIDAQVSRKRRKKERKEI